MKAFRIIFSTFVLCFLLSVEQIPAVQAATLNEHDITLITETSMPVIQVTVKSVAAGQWTNANPPQLVLNITYIVRGGKHPFDMQAAWKPAMPDFGWAGKQAEAKLEEWKAQPLQAPQVKSRWYVTGEYKDNIFTVSPVLRIPATSDTYKEIVALTKKHMTSEGPTEISMLEEHYARQARLDKWYQNLQNSNGKELLEKSDFVALATILEMDHDKRYIKFTISQIIKHKTLDTAPDVISLSGFPDSLYAALYDYNKEPAQSAPLAIFLKQSYRDALGKSVSVYAPVNAKESIQPATDKLKQALGVK